jgi:hypothetical protein
MRKEGWKCGVGYVTHVHRERTQGITRYILSIYSLEQKCTQATPLHLVAGVPMLQVNRCCKNFSRTIF